MASIADMVNSLGGMAQKQQLVSLGAGDLDLTNAVRRGEVIRARQGWYTTIAERDPRVRAVRVGGRLTGISAVQALGGWVLGQHPLHVSMHGNASRSRSQWDRRKRIGAQNTRGSVRHWDSFDVRERGTAMSVGLIDALVRVVMDESLEQAVAALDWALRVHLLDPIDFETLVLALPANRRHIRSWVDENCDSLPESLARTRLRLRGHHLASQVRFGDHPGPIDLVVDGCVAVETDGDEFHRNRFEEDRHKDGDITLAGFHAFRPSARMVFHEWDFVERAVEVAVLSRRPDLRFGNSGFRVPRHGVRRRNSALARAGLARIPEFAKPQAGGGDSAARE